MAVEQVPRGLPFKDLLRSTVFFFVSATKNISAPLRVVKKTSDERVTVVTMVSVQKEYRSAC
jgi:hypothetical protein